MGQQPNIEPAIEDRPRPVPRPGSARRWSPERPGDLGSPQAVPWGGAFGMPVPDGGFVARIVAERGVSLQTGQDRGDVIDAIRVVASGRASRFGRGPARSDVEVAERLLGVHPDGEQQSADERVARLRAAIGDPAALRRAVVEIADLLDAAEGTR